MGPSGAPAGAPSFEGQLVGGKYSVGALLGRGGMGSVWAGRHVNLDTPVAIKFIHPELAARPETRARFEIEARAAASVKSEHAVQIYDHGTTEAGLPYIVMEYLEGESLAATVRRVGAIAPVEVAKIVEHAARALTKAHQAGVVHRDLKPDNVFLATNVEHRDEELPYTVKLVDFGIAKILDTAGSPHGQRPTEPGSVIGTPNFMAPEQLSEGGAPDALTDLWSLGATVYTAMTGALPFAGDLASVATEVCTGPLPVPSAVRPGLPVGFDAWFASACSRDRAQRFQSAEEFSASLTRVCAPATPGDRRKGSGDRRDRGAGSAGRKSAPTPTPPPPLSAIAGGMTSEQLEALARQAPPARGLSKNSAAVAGVLVALMLAAGSVLWWKARAAEPLAPPAAVAPR